MARDYRRAMRTRNQVTVKKPINDTTTANSAYAMIVKPISRAAATIISRPPILEHLTFVFISGGKVAFQRLHFDSRNVLLIGNAAQK